MDVVCCECCVLSGRDLCDGLITRPEESYRLWWVVVCDLQTSWIRWPSPTRGGGGVEPKATRQTNTERLLCWVTAGVKSLNTTDLQERCFEFVTFCRGMPKCVQSTVNCAHVWLCYVHTCDRVM
jgi:hypothetical protein